MYPAGNHHNGGYSPFGALFLLNWFRLVTSNRVRDFRGSELVSAIWQFIKKYEFWVLMAICVGLAIAHEFTDFALYASISSLMFLVAIMRLVMHPMWKKGEQGEDK